MEITAVIPIYNRQRAGVRAIRSALCGGGPLGEIVAVDDASAEPFKLPRDLAKDRRVRLIRHEQNAGQSVARNTGVAAASNDWIAFLDSDDYWLPGKLEQEAAFAVADQKRTANLLVTYTHGFVQVNNTGRIRALSPVESRMASDFVSGIWFMPGSTVLLHKEAIAAVGPYDVKLRRLEDLDWFIRLALAGGCLKVAPFVGCVVEVGSRPGPEKVEQACAWMEGKWLEASKLPPQMQRFLAAYLDVERAAARYYSGQLLGAGYYFARSVAKVPRVRVALKRWWTKTKMPDNWKVPV